MTTKSMFAIYVVLLSAATAFGVLAVYQWERGKDAAGYAASVSKQNQLFATQIKDLKSTDEDLAEIIATVFDSDNSELLSKLSALKDRRPEVTDTPIFSRLWTAAKERESSDQSRYETSSGKDQGADAKAQDKVDTGQAASVTDRNGVEIVIKAKEESWIQILDHEGKPIFTKLLQGGETYVLSSSESVTLITGNPMGLELSIDGIVVPAFNAKGPARREIALDPARLLSGTAEEPAKRGAAPNQAPAAAAPE